MVVMIHYHSPDLVQHPPRGPRVRLGGFAILPCCLDKCRATLAGKNGAYHFNCPLDQRFFAFTGIGAEAFKTRVAQGPSDAEMLAWVLAHAPRPHDDMEILAWSDRHNHFTPNTDEARAGFNELVAAAGVETRADIVIWFDYLDADDFASFGGGV
jgi:Domain of unknown function (DUF5069)